jgi:AcrR family transcriptional regulator
MVDMASPEPTTTTARKAPTARERARAELTAEIKEVARRHLADQGAAALSLRAVARELGMVSSAVYRYFPSRDDLLTALLVDAYDAVADAAEEAERRTARAGVVARWLALAHAVRDWARANRADFDLVYGSPVPGYEAPQDTIAPAERLSAAFIRIVADGVASGDVEADGATSIPRAAHTDFGNLRAFAGVDIPDTVLSRSLLVWTNLFGTLSFELHGHLHNVITDYDAFFDLQMRRAAVVLLGAES